MLQLEDALPLFFKHVATITFQYPVMSELNKNLDNNEVLTHIDLGENCCCKFSEEIQADHFLGGLGHKLHLIQECYIYAPMILIIFVENKLLHIKWDEKLCPGEILSAFVNCMKS